MQPLDKEVTSHFMHLWVPTPPPSGRCGTGGMFAQPHHSLRIEPRHGVSSWMGRLYSHSLVSKLSTAPMSSSLSRDAESLGSRGPPQPSLISTDLAQTSDQGPSSDTIWVPQSYRHPPCERHKQQLHTKTHLGQLYF